MRSILVPVLVAMSMTTAAPALAETQEVKIRIQYGDLDLTKPKDVNSLRKRIDLKIKQACTHETSLSMISRTVDYDCVRGAKELALAELEKRHTATLAMR